MFRVFFTYLFLVLLTESAFAQTFSADSLNTMPKADPFVVAPAGGRNVEDLEVNEAKDDTIDQISNAFVGKDLLDDNSNDPVSQISNAFSSQQQNNGDVEKTVEEEEIFIPEGELYRLDTPTLDGSKRGGQAFVQVDEKGRMKKVSNIFLYYDNFEMSSMMAGMATCNVRFNILSNLDQKINRLDVKLVWPGLTTTLSFADVPPNTRTYYNYALLGDGCYNMAKAPNIVVNRCRVKGMTAAECANKLVWLTK